MKSLPSAALAGGLERYVGSYVLVSNGRACPVAWYVCEVSRGGQSVDLANGVRVHRSGKLRSEDGVWGIGKLICSRAFASADAAYGWLEGWVAERDDARAGETEARAMAQADRLALRTWRAQTRKRLCDFVRAADDDTLRRLVESLT